LFYVSSGVWWGSFCIHIGVQSHTVRIVFFVNLERFPVLSAVLLLLSFSCFPDGVTVAGVCGGCLVAGATQLLTFFSLCGPIIFVGGNIVLNCARTSLSTTYPHTPASTNSTVFGLEICILVLLHKSSKVLSLSWSLCPQISQMAK
jgi:hypothetical protein